jgi:anti-anti-sigma factor
LTRLAELSFEERDGVRVARISGELDLSNTADIAEALLTETSSERLGLVIDMGELRHIDSSGVRALFDLGRRLAQRRQRLALAVPRDARIRAVLELAAVESRLPVTESVDAALAAIRDPAPA